MTLKEKFQNIPSDYLPLSNNQKNECVLIADEFAIGFLSWTNTYKDFSTKTNKQLLEIY